MPISLNKCNGLELPKAEAFSDRQSVSISASIYSNTLVCNFTGVSFRCHLAYNNNMYNPMSLLKGVMIVACYHRDITGYVFIISMMLLSPPHAAPCFYPFWHFNPYMLQHFTKNVITLVHYNLRTSNNVTESKIPTDYCCVVVCPLRVTHRPPPSIITYLYSSLHLRFTIN